MQIENPCIILILTRLKVVVVLLKCRISIKSLGYTAMDSLMIMLVITAGAAIIIPPPLREVFGNC